MKEAFMNSQDERNAPSGKGPLIVQSASHDAVGEHVTTFRNCDAGMPGCSASASVRRSTSTAAADEGSASRGFLDLFLRDSDTRITLPFIRGGKPPRPPFYSVGSGETLRNKARAHSSDIGTVDEEDRDGDMNKSARSAHQLPIRADSERLVRARYRRRHISSESSPHPVVDTEGLPLDFHNASTSSAAAAVHFRGYSSDRLSLSEADAMFRRHERDRKSSKTKAASAVRFQSEPLAVQQQLSGKRYSIDGRSRRRPPTPTPFEEPPATDSIGKPFVLRRLVPAGGDEFSCVEEPFLNDNGSRGVSSRNKRSATSSKLIPAPPMSSVDQAGASASRVRDYNIDEGDEYVSSAPARFDPALWRRPVHGDDDDEESEKRCIEQAFIDYIRYASRRRKGASDSSKLLSPADRFKQRTKPSPDVPLAVTVLCYALSVVGRRVFSAAAHGGRVAAQKTDQAYVDFITKMFPESSEINTSESQLMQVLLGRFQQQPRSTHTSTSKKKSIYSEMEMLHATYTLMRGDVRVAAEKDLWVLEADAAILINVFQSAVKRSIKLAQDHLAVLEENVSPSELYKQIVSIEKNWFITYEADPQWRERILQHAPRLLALRKSVTEYLEEYHLVMLQRRVSKFRVIKLNRECVRGLWSGQQQELIFLRNPNSERGSIQNAKQVLRNMINSSCDQPIGYPLYVSPIMSSFASNNTELRGIAGGELSLSRFGQIITNAWNTLRFHCRVGCVSSGDQGTLRSTAGYSLAPVACPPPPASAAAIVSVPSTMAQLSVGDTPRGGGFQPTTTPPHSSLQLQVLSSGIGPTSSRQQAAYSFLRTPQHVRISNETPSSKQQLLQSRTLPSEGTNASGSRAAKGTRSRRPHLSNRSTHPGIPSASSANQFSALREQLRVSPPDPELITPCIPASRLMQRFVPVRNPSSLPSGTSRSDGGDEPARSAAMFEIELSMLEAEYRRSRTAIDAKAPIPNERGSVRDSPQRRSGSPSIAPVTTPTAETKSSTAATDNLTTEC